MSVSVGRVAIAHIGCCPVNGKQMEDMCYQFFRDLKWLVDEIIPGNTSSAAYGQPGQCTAPEPVEVQ
jgi:hypothetical protein